MEILVYYMNPEDYKEEIINVLRINLPLEIKRQMIEIWLKALDDEIEEVVCTGRA